MTNSMQIHAHDRAQHVMSGEEVVEAALPAVGSATAFLLMLLSALV